MIKRLSPSQILDDLETLYTLALEKENFSVALKVKELLGKECGLFFPSAQRKPVSLKELSDEDLDLLIKRLETQIVEGIDRKGEDR